MFAKFRMSIDEVRSLASSRYILEESVKEIRAFESSFTTELSKMFSPTNGIINGEDIKAQYFPTDLKKKYNVFICHSHGDVAEIERFAEVLYSDYGLTCFLDSMVWKNIAQLQKTIDNKYSKSSSGGYDYRLVQQSTAHIYSLLSIALFEMIDQCECCLFVQSDNSLQINLNNANLTTLSPWIYEEIYYMNHTRKIRPKRIPETRYFSIANESRNIDVNIKMSHVVDLSDFKPLSASDFKMQTLLQGEKFLDNLYWKHLQTKMV